MCQDGLDLWGHQLREAAARWSTCQVQRLPQLYKGLPFIVEGICQGLLHALTSPDVRVLRAAMFPTFQGFDSRRDGAERD